MAVDTSCSGFNTSAHLRGDADIQPIEGRYQYRCAADHHEERYEDRVLECELDYQIPVVQWVVYDIQRVVNFRRVLVKVVELQFGVDDTLRASVQLIVGNG